MNPVGTREPTGPLILPTMLLDLMESEVVLNLLVPQILHPQKIIVEHIPKPY